jgi:hypothetical protein
MQPVLAAAAMAISVVRNVRSNYVDRSRMILLPHAYSSKALMSGSLDVDRSNWRIKGALCLRSFRGDLEL